VGMSKIKKTEKTITTIGVNIQGGVDKVYNLTKSWEKPYFLFDINPYIKYDRKWIGMWGGINVGNLRWIPTSPINDKTFDEGTRFSPVMPEVSLRLGRRDILDLKYSYGFNFPSTFPMLLNEISIGSGLGNKNDFTVRYGFGFSKSSDLKSCSFISTEAVISKDIGFTFKYNFGSTFYSNLEEFPFTSKGRILIGLNYRFGFTK